MPIKVNVDNNSTVRVRPEDNTSSVTLSSGSSVDLKRLEILIKQLQQTKQDLGFIYLDDYLPAEQYQGTIPTSMLNLLTTYLVNKIYYNGNVYSLSNIQGHEPEQIYEYMCVEVVPNTIKVFIHGGHFEIYNKSISIADHALLSHLDYASSGHTGFAGIQIKTTTEWEALYPWPTSDGIIYVYSDYAKDAQGRDVAGIKIGDKNHTYLGDKPFVDSNILDALNAHIEDVNAHVSSVDRTNWNQKVDEPDTIDEDMLILTIDKYLN